MRVGLLILGMLLSLNSFAVEDKKYVLSSYFKQLETNDQYTFVNKEIINYLKALEDKIAEPVAIEEAELSTNNNRLKKRPGSKMATDVNLLIGKMRSVLYLKMNRNLDYSHKKVFHEFNKIENSVKEEMVLVNIYNLSQKILNAVFDIKASQCPEGYELNQTWVFRQNKDKIPSFVCKHIEGEYGVLFSIPKPYVDFVMADHTVEIPTHEFYDEQGNQIYDMKTFFALRRMRLRFLE